MQSAATVQAVSHLVAVHDVLAHSVAPAQVAPPAFLGVQVLVPARSQNWVPEQSLLAAQLLPFVCA